MRSNGFVWNSGTPNNHGLPWSTMVYHGLPSFSWCFAATKGWSNRRICPNRWRSGWLPCLNRPLPTWDSIQAQGNTYGISMGYLWIWEVRDSMDMNFMCAVVNLVKTWATCQPWGMVFNPLGIEKFWGPQKDRTVFPGWYRWRFFIILTIVFPIIGCHVFGVARGTSRIPLRWRSPVNPESPGLVYWNSSSGENTYFFSGLLCSNGWLVVWNMAFNYFSHHIGNVIISTDEVHHFSEGLAAPTSHN